MKKLLSLILVVAMVVSLAACAKTNVPSETPVEQPQATQPAQTTPQPVASTDEDPVFLLVDERPFDLVGADISVYQHAKTGAQVVFIENEDTNRAFEITFRTPAENDMGVPHVFEHSTLDGSEKYPSKALFFNLSARTYNTYMNAATYNFMTTFPIASMSEEQLLKYADYYTDSCFNPMIYEDESIFLEEAWRYVMEDEDSPLTVAGTVYSEMQGAMDIDATADLNFKKIMLPGSTYANESGGVPSEILKMQWQDIKDYHTNYYHPSNSITCIYGKIEDKDAFLDLLDGYFSNYEKKDFNIQDSNYQPITGHVADKVAFGVTEGSNTENGTNISYGFVLGNLSEEDCWKLDMLTTLLDDNGSVYSQNMKEQFPAANYGCYYDFSGPEVFVEFYAYGVNEDDSEAFKALVDDSLAQQAKEGFSADAVDAIIASTMLDIMLSTESSDVGVNVIPEMMYYNYGFNDLYSYINYVDALDNFGTYFEDGTFTQCLKDMLIGCDRTALVATYPEPGLKEHEDNALTASLNAKLVRMSQEDKDAIIAQTAALAEEEDDDSTEYVKQLQAVTVDSLPVEYRIYDTKDETGSDNIRRLDVYANTVGVGTANVLIDASGFGMDQIQYFQLFTQILGDMDTTEHTSAELSTLMTRYLYGGALKVSLMTDEDGYVYPYLRATFTALDDDLQGGYDLISELLYGTTFSDTKTLQNLVSGLKNSLKRSINADPYLAQMYRAMGYTTDLDAYYDYINYLPYYDFLCGVEEQLSKNPDKVVAELEKIQAALNNSYGAVLAYAGSKESAAINRPIADAFAASLGSEEITFAEFDFPLPEFTEAIIVDGSVNYNFVYSDFWDMGLLDPDDEDKNDVDLGTLTILCSYIQDQYMYPQLRDQYGAYGAYCDLADYGIYLLSYRDPNIWESFEVYMDLPAWLEENAKNVDQETLNDYILSSFAYYAAPAGELTGAQSALLSLIGYTAQEDTLEYLNELKGVTVESFNEYTGIFQTLVDQGLWSTSGSISKINDNYDIYDAVYNPFGTIDKSNLYKDVKRGSDYYEALQYVIAESMMEPVGETEFGVSKDATLGELALACDYAMGYYDDTAAEAIEWLSEYNIWPNDKPGTVLTRDKLLEYCTNFLIACGVDVTKDDTLDFCFLADENDDYRLSDKATREELAYAIWGMFSE